jgi:hypothetical protein
MLSSVVSWPSCGLVEQVNPLAGLSASWPACQGRLVVSRNCRSWEATLPKRVGVPNTYPCAHTRLWQVAVVTPALLHDVFGVHARLVPGGDQDLPAYDRPVDAIAAASVEAVRS